MTDDVKPAFDPSKPFEAVSDKPAFDPSKPFEPVLAGKPSGVGGVALDMLNSAGSGIAKAAETAPGIPGTLTDLGAKGIEAASNFVSDKLGVQRYQRPAAPSVLENIPTVSSIQDAIEKVAPFYKPQTTPGKFAETVGEMVPAAATGGGGLVSRIMSAVIPGVTSEAAGEASAGTKYEGMMRFLGGLTGNVVHGIGASRVAAPERMVREATHGVTPAEFDAAGALHQRAADIGVPLSGPEAVQAATNNATRLGDMQRVVEGSAGGGTQTARFYSERPGQVEAAVNNTLDTVAPASANPSTLGPRAAEAAGNEIDQVRRNINTATRPAYQQAENHVLAPADFDPIARSPAFQASLNRLRNDEVLGPIYHGQPDNSVAVIDAVTKDMRDRGVALSNASNPGFSAQTAGRYTQDSHTAREIARDPQRGGVQAYDDALVAQEQARRQNLEPLDQGPLGRVAAATDTRGAANAVLPPKPLTGGQNELVDAIQRVEQQAPGVGQSLVRQRLADQFDTSAGRLVGGENQYGGARFAKDIAGTPQAETNLRDVTNSLRVGPFQPGGPPPSDLENLVDVLRATGARKPQGSATAFNQQITHELQLPPVSAELAAAAKTGGLSIPTGVRDRAKRAWLGRGTGQLADLFLAPDSVEQMRGISQRAAQTPMSDAMLRQLFETPSEVNRGR